MQNGWNEHVLGILCLSFAEIYLLSLVLTGQVDLLHEITTKYVDRIRAHSYFKFIPYHNIGRRQHQLSQSLYSPHLKHALGEENDNVMRVFEWESNHIPPSHLETAADVLNGYFANGELWWREVGKPVVVGGIDKRWLSETFEDGLADYLHQLIYSRLLYRDQA